MILVANSYLAAFLSKCNRTSSGIYTYLNDLKQIQYQDSFCIFQVYSLATSITAFYYSFLLQAFYRYVNVIYTNRLFWQSIRFQALLICLIWIFASVYPIIFIFTNAIAYDFDSQICTLSIQLNFASIFPIFCVYSLPISMIMSMYSNLIRYVKEIKKRVTPTNTLSRAQKEVKMVRRTVTLIIILVTLSCPYTIFIFLSSFINRPKYFNRVIVIFFDAAMLFVIIVLFQFTDPLNTSLMKVVKRRTNMVVPTME